MNGYYGWSIPMNYVHKGTQMLLSKEPETILAVADMDGHIVSPNYGKMADSSRTHYADDPETNYINVRFNHLNGFYRGEGSAADYFRVNDSIHERDGWIIFVNFANHQRYLKDKALFEQDLSERQKTIKRDELTAQLVQARALIQKVETDLEALSDYVQGG